MKKNIQITLVLIVIFVILIFPQAASAGGWWKVSDTDPITADMPEWTDMPGNYGANITSPHGGYSTSSNLCKTCHAVHDAGITSYRLLKSGSTDFEVGDDRTAGELRGEEGSRDSVEGAGNRRETECMYCHDASAGLTNKKPYELTVLGHEVRGEHTLGATSVPDSDINGGTAPNGKLYDRNPVTAGGIGAELDCYQCHSVHGADTIGHDADNDGTLDAINLDGNIYDGGDYIETWNAKILRVDPSGDGTPLASGIGGIDGTELANEPTAVRTGFCADCHNRNPNWVTTTGTVGPNKKSHVQGRGTDGLLEVYGNADVAVAGHTAEVQGCRGCHAASDGAGSEGRFPHQSVGWKLMWDSYVTSGTSAWAGDPYRPLPGMDQACLMCHPVDDEFETGKGYKDVSTEQKLCYRCHKVDSFAGAPNIEDEFSKDSTHPVGRSGLHSEDEWTDPVASLGAGNRHSECLDCHNMDAVLQGQGNPLRGIWGVSVTNGVAGSVPTLTKVDGVSLQFEVCFKCHSSYTTRPDSNYYTDSGGTPVGQEDKSVVFNPNNNAFHPIEGAGRNKSGALENTLLGSLTGDSVIKCTDCHNSDGTDDAAGKAANSTYEPQGPHGSTNTPVLRDNYRTDLTTLPSTYDTNDFALCYLCHDEALLNSTSPGYTNFYDSDSINAYGNLHRTHLKLIRFAWGFGDGGLAACRACHYDTHSNQQEPNTQYEYYDGSWNTSSSAPVNGIKSHLVNFAPTVVTAFSKAKPSFLMWETTESATNPARQRLCNLTCHGNNGNSENMNGIGGWGSNLYIPPAATDDVMTYTP